MSRMRCGISLYSLYRVLYFGTNIIRGYISANYRLLLLKSIVTIFFFIFLKKHFCAKEEKRKMKIMSPYVEADVEYKSEETRVAL